MKNEYISFTMRKNEIPIYRHILSYFEGQEFKKYDREKNGMGSELEEQIYGMMGNRVFAKDALEYGLSHEYIIEIGNKYKVVKGDRELKGLDYSKYKEVIKEERNIIKWIHSIIGNSSHIEIGKVPEEIEITILEWNFGYINGDNRITINRDMLDTAYAFFIPEETEAYKKFFSNEEHKLL